MKPPLTIIIRFLKNGADKESNILPLLKMDAMRRCLARFYYFIKIGS
jgi:hypothetical protein